jgi:MFS family permease
MFFAIDHDIVTRGIQLAVAPVFLMTAVAGTIGAVVGRLARIIDRARVLEDRIEAAPAGQPMTAAFEELDQLRRRGLLVNVCIALLTFCAILIGLTIVALFLVEITELEILRMATYCFLAGVICFLLALVCFLAETLLATRLLKFSRTEALRRQAGRTPPPP